MMTNTMHFDNFISPYFKKKIIISSLVVLSDTNQSIFSYELIVNVNVLLQKMHIKKKNLYSNLLVITKK